MKRFCLFLLGVLLFFPFNSSSQAGEENSGIALNAIVPDLGEDFNSRNRRILQSRLDQITSNYGTGGANFNPNFVVVPHVIITGYERIGGAPPRTLAKLEVVLQTGNAETQTKFSSLAMKTNGVGENNAEAIHNALSKLDTRSDDLENFIEETKKEIVNYYENNCSDILKQAMSSAETENFKKAFSYLNRIPSSASCYDEAQAKVEEIFPMYQESKCAKLVTAARAAHGAGNMDKAARYLALVPTNSDCQEKAKKLAEKMEDERIMKFKTEAEIRKSQIEAAKEIAIAFAENQPDERVDIRFLNPN